MSGSQTFDIWLGKAALFLDPYERQARLFPALLCLFPALFMAIALYSDQLLNLKGLGAFVGGVGLMHLLADIAQSKGKGTEKRLWQEWGGVPSIQMLRHRDDFFDAVSKRRYHDLLAKKINVPFPTREAEAKDPDAADAAYAAAGNWLRETTRERTKFYLLFRANVSYGYRRNGFGVRWLGLSVCLAVVGWVLIRLGPDSWSQRLGVATHPEAFLDAGEAASIGVAVFMSAIWLCYFTEARVREAAFSYAQRLILTCEVFPSRSPAKSAPSGKNEPEK